MLLLVPLLLMSDGSLIGFGQNNYGQLLHCTTGHYFTPITVGSGLSGVADLDGTWYSSSVLLSNGSLKIYGYNDYGQLGVGTRDVDVHCSASTPNIPRVRTVRVLPFPDVAYAGEDVSLCKENHPFMELGTPYCRNVTATYAWTPATGLSSTTHGQSCFKYYGTCLRR